MQDQATETQTFAMRRDTFGLWVLTSGKHLEEPGQDSFVIPIFLASEDIFPDDHGAVYIVL